MPEPTGLSTALADSGSTTPGPLPIGEVLSLVKEEFPDVTISKIRFLESQGLIQPERTASGYRRFSSADIERLQWILRQQRDHFLPLKVIRRMLDEGVDRYDAGGGAQPTLFSSAVRDDTDEPDETDEATDEDDVTAGEEDDSAERSGAGEPARPPRSAAHPTVASAREQSRRTRRESPGQADDAPGTGPAAGDAPETPGGEVDARSESLRPPHETPADVVAALQEDPRPAKRASAEQRRSDRPVRRPAVPVEEDDSGLTAEDLCAREGIDPAQLADLERFGLVQPRAGRGGDRTYGPSAVEVVRLAVRYRELGVEARHLRMYLVAAEREAGMLEQLTVPLLKQRNPRAREHASELATELAELGSELHRSILRRELGRDLLP